MDFGAVEKKEQVDQVSNNGTDEVSQKDDIKLIPPSEFKGNARLPGESFEDYKKRRKIENLSTRHHLRGRVVRVASIF